VTDVLDPADLLRDLLAATRASRATLRLDVGHMNFPVIAEAAAPGVRPLSGDQSLDQRNLHTVQHLFRTHEILVQDDCSRAEPAPPPALLEAYGVQAQMLAPLVLDGAVLGWVSLHDCVAPRDWSEADVAALRETAALLKRGLCGDSGRT
jgi:maleate isomerase